MNSFGPGLKGNLSRPRRWLLIAVLMVSVLFSSLMASTLPAQAASDGSEFFPVTGFSVSGDFLSYWQSHGGLAIFGYPITAAHYEKDPTTGKTFLTQWFERNRFELHPENAGTPYVVLLGLLGNQITTTRHSEPAFQPVAPSANTASHIYFSQTGHSLSNTFKSYWETHGGLALFGYPISQEFQESTAQGTFTVQYFERNRFELHPEKQPPYNVELGLLGTQLEKPDLTPVISDQSSPEGVLISYYNAIDRGDYARAYKYWTTPGTSATSTPPDFNTFKNGYASTASVGLSIGTVQSDGTAGTIYFSAATVLIATQKNGTIQRYFGCYGLKQVDVEVNNMPPPQPATLYNAHIFSAPAATSMVALLSLAEQTLKNGTCDR